MADFYQILGVARDADADTLKRAYRKLARQYHPDVNKEPGAEDKFKEIGKAYEALADPETRARYDQFGEDFIIEELQRGYHLEGKVLRHALVKVSMGPGKQNSQEEVEKDTVEESIDSEENTSEDV